MTIAGDLTNRILHGDCVQVMRSLPAESVDFIMTDPPYLVRYRDRTAGASRTMTEPIGSSLPSPRCFGL